MQTMKTEDAIKWAGGTVKLGAIFGVTHSAVSQWGDVVPRGRQYELRFKRPRWFARDGSLKPPPDPAKAVPAEAAAIHIEGQVPAVVVGVGTGPAVATVEGHVPAVVVGAAEVDPSIFPGR